VTAQSPTWFLVVYTADSLSHELSHSVWSDGDRTITHFDFLTGEKRTLVADTAPAGTALVGHTGADFYLMDAFVKAVATDDPSLLLTGAEQDLTPHLPSIAASIAASIRGCSSCSLVRTHAWGMSANGPMSLCTTSTLFQWLVCVAYRADGEPAEPPAGFCCREGTAGAPDDRAGRRGGRAAAGRASRRGLSRSSGLVVG
jgi:hypothetical protein